MFLTSSEATVPNIDTRAESKPAPSAEGRACMMARVASCSVWMANLNSMLMRQNLPHGSIDQLKRLFERHAQGDIAGGCAQLYQRGGDAGAEAHNDRRRA